MVLGNLKAAINGVTTSGSNKAKGETDEPVTADVKRLIRLPGSLHGKSGLKVVTLTRGRVAELSSVSITRSPWW